MKLSTRTVLRVLTCLIVLICFYSVSGRKIAADSTIIESGSLSYCDWELDADGNLFVLCKSNSIRLDWLFKNIENEVKTVSFDVSNVGFTDSVSFDGYGKSVSSITVSAVNSNTKTIYISEFPDVDENHIFIPEGIKIEKLALRSMPVKSLKFLKDLKISELVLEECNDLKIDDLDFSGSLKTLRWFDFPNKELYVPDNGCSYMIQSDVLEKVVIASGRTEINDHMFYKCYALSDVTLPDSIKTIGENAFGGCVALTDIVIPDSVTVIGVSAFESTDLQSVNLPSGLKRIEDKAFQYSKLQTVTLPDSMEYIGHSAFCSTLLESVKIPSGITRINAYVFSDCVNLKNIQIPDGVTGIGAEAFCNCPSLTEISLPEGLTEISWNAFYMCSNLKKIDLPKSVRKIDAYAFAETAIEYVDIPSGVARIENNAFENCKNLKIVVLPESIKAIVADAFLGCKAIEKVYYSGTKAQFDSISTPAHVLTNPNNEVVYSYSVNSIYNIFSSTTLNYNSTSPGTWIHDEKGWRYLNLNGTHAVSDWQYINKKWYYFDETGYMVTGWKQMSGVWYYFNSSGQMQTRWQTIDGLKYYFNENGAMLTGWQNLNSRWYRFNSVGVLQTGWQCIDGKWYYFDDSGVMQTGWVSKDADWYYMDPDSGARVKGWKKIDGSWFYFNPENAVMVTGWKSIGGSWYYFNDLGIMITGWKQLSGTWYFFNESGAMQTGWKKIGDTWYYFNSSGAMLTGWQNINGKWYYFYSSGAMAHDTTIDGYKLNSSGAWIS